MAPVANHSKETVVAVGLALRAEAVEPTRALLSNKLNRSGHSKTVWKYWSEFVQSQAACGTPLAAASLIAPLSPEMTRAEQGVSTALATLKEQVRRETEAPLLAQIGALTSALVAAQQVEADKDELIEMQHQEIELPRKQLAKNASPKSSLIMASR